MCTWFSGSFFFVVPDEPDMQLEGEGSLEQAGGALPVDAPLRLEVVPFFIAFSSAFSASASWLPREGGQSQTTRTPVVAGRIIFTEVVGTSAPGY